MTAIHAGMTTDASISRPRASDRGETVCSRAPNARQERSEASRACGDAVRVMAFGVPRRAVRPPTRRWTAPTAPRSARSGRG